MDTKVNKVEAQPPQQSVGEKKKAKYIAPEIKVVEFRVEGGYGPSAISTSSHGDFELIGSQNTDEGGSDHNYGSLFSW